MDPEIQNKIRNLPMVVSLTDTSINKTGSWSLQKPDFSTKSPPCQEGCPAQVPVREVLAKVRTGDFESAAALYLSVNPFPAITGRVCHHPCQSACLRSDFDDALEIREVERILGNYINIKADIPVHKSENIQRIAVVGSGPSGLACAYFLRLRGYEVTLFDKHSKAGGMLRIGIPQYRLPADVLDKEIKRLQEMGIKFKTGVEVTNSFIKDNLSEYDAVFLGIGAHKSLDIRLSESDLEQYLSGLDFLSNFAQYGKEFAQKKVAVIGGGNTAMDAARTSLRLGADVTVIYRRTRDEMPAIHEEIEGAIDEGCTFNFLTSPVKIHQNEGKLDLSCVKMMLGEPDESGRPHPVPVLESNYLESFDYIISAVGEFPNTKQFDNLIILENSDILVNNFSQTSEPYIFAGGDAAGNPRSVIDAIASGTNAANSIYRFLEGLHLVETEIVHDNLIIDDLNTVYFQSAKSVEIESLSPKERIENFNEIISDISEVDAIKEADRCFSCGACNYCDNCVIFCPDSAIVTTENEYLIKDEYCKGCGICLKECPRSVLLWRSKE